MSFRRPVLTLICGLTLVALAACAPGGVAPTATPTDDTPPTPGTPTVDIDLPADAVFALTALATATNGATLDVSLIVHAPLAFNAPGAEAARSATTAWCMGEVDDGVISDQGYTFATVDAIATPREGEWPAEAYLVIYPLPKPLVTVAAGGDLHQVDRLADLGEGPTPHCGWPAVLDGPGSGQLFLGFPGDIDGDGDLPPLSGWANYKYGFQSAWAEEDPPNIVFTECVGQITAAGDALGAPSALWEPVFFDDLCVEGGAVP